MYYHVELGAPRSDHLQLVRIGFGAPANNDVIVRDAVQAIEQLKLSGGKGVLFDGPASLPLRMQWRIFTSSWHVSIQNWDVLLLRFPTLRTTGQEI